MERYDFGRNWSEFSAEIDGKRIQSAAESLVRLVPNLNNLSILDIGSGSGIHALAALRSGAKDVVCVDYDINSVKTSEALLASLAPESHYTVMQDDILAGNRKISGKQFDLVYSWGVLHHTGSMNQAILNAMSHVKSGGQFVIALYMKTPMCGFWTVEKKLYSRFKWLRPFIKFPFACTLLMRNCLAEKIGFKRYLNEYKELRGMSFWHDVDDWLGGYPYESVTDSEVINLFNQHNFSLVKKMNTAQGKGFFGTGCGEWVFKKNN